jgi:hypothetical protein
MAKSTNEAMPRCEFQNTLVERGPYFIHLEYCREYSVMAYTTGSRKIATGFLASEMNA